MSDVTEPEPTSEILFAESGASWLWLLAGPAAGLAMFLIQLNSGLGVRWAVPLAFFVLVSAFLAGIPPGEAYVLRTSTRPPSSRASSPLASISRTMSQPPTNSPRT